MFFDSEETRDRIGTRSVQAVSTAGYKLFSSIELSGALMEMYTLGLKPSCTSIGTEVLC